MRLMQSLRGQLAVGVSAILVILWLGAVLGSAYVVRREIDESFDAALQETGNRILPLAVVELIGAGEGGAALRILPIAEHDEKITYDVRDADGRVLLYSHDADPAVFDNIKGEGFFTTADHRVFSRSAVSGQYTIQVAEPLVHRQQALRETVLAMLVPLGVLLPLSLFGIALWVSRALRPLSHLSVALRLKGADDLTPLHLSGLRTELLPIQQAANRLMARLKRALEAERSFAANAAHELRTPIAATLAQTQRLVAESPEGPLRQRAAQVEAELKRLSRLAEKLMQLARAEGGAMLSTEHADLVPILQVVLTDFARASPGRIKVEIPSLPVPSRLDPDAFAVLARNLIENALVHGSQAPVIVALTAEGVFSVTNDCAPIPPEVLSTLTMRFERAGARSTGSGLGLAIAAGIARGLGQNLVLRSPVSGDRGFQVALSLT
ncbi:MAG: histidine kinase dimerization/phospho-acceptor domain-containing protein [Cypionkella sp.]